ncbi:LOW QUALITY PROTEIN: transmembrane transporter, partial [Neisseria gonorrhoeae 1291]
DAHRIENTQTLGGHCRRRIHPADYHRHEDDARTVRPTRRQHHRIEHCPVQPHHRRFPTDVGRIATIVRRACRPFRRVQGIKRRCPPARLRLPDCLQHPDLLGADDCRRAAARIRHRFRRVFHHYGTGRRPSPHTQTRLGIRTGQRRRFGRTIPVRTAGSRTQGLVVLPEVGWTGTFYVWGAIALLILPVSWWLAGGNNAAHTQHTQATHGQSLGEAVKTAFKTPSYILLHLSFFACGFHIAFLVTHLPTEVALCGLPATVASTSIAIIGLANIAGCVFSG